MGHITIHNCQQGDDIWHLLHEDTWTGSTAIKLLQGKPLPEWGTFLGNKYTRRGKILEEIAIAEYERETGISVLRPGFVTNSKHPNAGFSPDGIDEAILEVKCLNGERHEKLVAGEIPLEYLAQINFGRVITELKTAKLLAFNPEYEQQLTIIDIPYSETIIDNIKRKLEASLTKIPSL